MEGTLRKSHRAISTYLQVVPYLSTILNLPHIKTKCTEHVSSTLALSAPATIKVRLQEYVAYYIKVHHKGFFFNPNTAMNRRISTKAGSTLEGEKEK